MTHEFGPNGHIVDAFIAHIKGMTPEQWKPVIAAWDAAWDAAGDAGDAAWDAAGDAGDAAGGAAWAARDAAWDAGDAAGGAAWAAGDAAWDAARAAGHAAWEIQGADLMRERGQPFFFLPMFGFADETAIVPPATQADDALVEELARVLFAASFHPDDQANKDLIMKKWNDWPADARKATKQARAILPILHRREAAAHAAGRAENYETFTDGMEAAAQICGSLAETTYDDADAFEAATGCEAAIMRVVKDQRKEQVDAIERGQHGSKGDE